MGTKCAPPFVSRPVFSFCYSFIYFLHITFLQNLLESFNMERKIVTMAFKFGIQNLF
jgi:hypothetical protein